MDINYKLVEHERIGDAPFIGALISACDCKFNCKGCFNQGIKNLPIITKDSADIIAEIRANKFNKGIILAGLEWTLQFDEAIELAGIAKKYGLMTMLYTGQDMWTISNQYKDLSIFDYIKAGRFLEQLNHNNHKEYGVYLASINQHIYKKGINY